MKLYAPGYYRNFTCIADRCRHSCCIGWEIDIDDSTLSCYRALKGTYSEQIRQSIDGQGTPHFRLAESERCPHLNEQGLCRIILNYGESYLCDICREHPRFYHETPRGLEVGLGMACEEACRIILASDDYAEFVEIETLDGEPDRCDFDALTHRERIYAMLSDRTRPYTERLSELSRLYDVTPAALSDEQWRRQFASLEYLDRAHLSWFEAYSSHFETPRAWETVLERALAYFVYRHCSQAEDADELRAALGLCLVCERLLASLIRSKEARDTETVIELARVISEELEYSEDNTEALRNVFFK